MKIEIVSFKAEHLDLIEERPETKNLKLRKKDGIMLQAHPSMTMLVDGVIKACGGCVYLWPNTGQFWAVTSTDIRYYAKEFNEATLRFLDSVVGLLRLTRMECTVKADFKIGHKWVKYLGFTFNCVLEKYINDQDYWLYSRVFGEG